MEQLHSCGAGAPLLKGQDPAQMGQMNTSLEGTIYEEITLVSAMPAGFPKHKFLSLPFLWLY